MELKNLIYKKYIQTVYLIDMYLIHLPCLVIHEICHFIVALIGMYFLKNACPTLSIKFPKVEYDVENNDITAKLSGSVSYNRVKINGGKIRKYNFYEVLINIAPMVGYIFLLIYSPMYLKIFFILGTKSLMLSKSDLAYILDYITFKKKVRKIRKIRKK